MADDKDTPAALPGQLAVDVLEPPALSVSQEMHYSRHTLDYYIPAK